MRGTGIMMAVGIPIGRAERICEEVCNKSGDSSAVVVAAINSPTRYPILLII